MNQAKAFAPATVANVAVGFDILGFALENLGETAVVEKLEKSRQVILSPIPNYPELTLDPLKNTATAGLVRLIQEKKLNHGFRVKLIKSIPVGSGLGGSSTSAVAAIVAANALLKKKLTKNEILDYALTGEAVASGSRHGDNVGPCLAGGLVLIRTQPELQIVKIKTPQLLRCIIILPDVSIKTKEARALLAQKIDLKLMVEQSANLAGFILGCAQSDLELIRNSLKDVVIEPQRAQLIPGFYELQNEAISNGALGFSISGSGPAMFALVAGPIAAKKIEKKLIMKAQQLGLKLKGHWVSKISAQGAKVLR